MLPRWVSYYRSQFGADNLVVLDDGSDDSSTDDPGCPVLRLPRRSDPDVPFAAYKARVANKLGACLLESYDYVMFTDVDEFIVADPRRYASLTDYITQHSDAEVIAPLGMNLLHVPPGEQPLERDRPLLAQRRHVKLVPRMCKPAIKRVPARWLSGTHGVARPFDIRSDLFLVHAKFADFDETLRMQRARHHEFTTRGSGSSASWRLDVDEVAARYAGWVATPEGRPPAVADFDRVNTAGVVRTQPDGTYCCTGGQLTAMERGDLLQLPEYIGQPV